MAQSTNSHKPGAAMLRNVSALLEAIERLRGRAAHLPGLGCIYGPSGFGKTTAMATAAAMGGPLGACHIEAMPSWGRREFLDALALSLGVTVGRTIAKTMQAIGDHLLAYQPVLLIDEADVLVDRGMIELVRELHMISETPLILSGEEGMPAKLKRFERVHNRVLVWLPFQAASLGDARHLAQLYVAGVVVADDLLAHLVEARRGRIRRIVVNLEQILIEATREGRDAVDLAWWGGRQFDTGEAPARRLA